MVTDRDLLVLMRAINDGDHTTATRLLRVTPELATARLVTNSTNATAADFFLGHVQLQVYAGDTVLHVAAAAYDTVLARSLVGAGADVRAPTAAVPNRFTRPSPVYRGRRPGHPSDKPRSSVVSSRRERTPTPPPKAG